MHIFWRRIIVLVTELDRDMTVEKLQDGIKHNKQTNQQGRPKVSDTLSLLERLHPSVLVPQWLRKVVAKHERIPPTVCGPWLLI